MRSVSRTWCCDVRLRPRARRDTRLRWLRSPPARRNGAPPPPVPRRRAELAAPRRAAAARSRHAAPEGRRGGTTQPGDAVLDRVARGRRPPSRRPDGRGPSPRARLRRSPRVATGRRRQRHARSRAPSSLGGTNPDASGTRARSGPSPTITRGSPAVASSELVDPLLLGEPPDEEHVRRLVRLPDVAPGSRRRSGRRARRPRRASRAAAASDSDGTRTMRARRSRAAGDPRRPLRELDVRAPELDDERPPRRERRKRRGEPVRVDEVGAASRATGRPRERREEERQRAAPSTARAGGSRRSRARTRARSGGTRRARRRRRRSRPREGARPRPGRTLPRRRPARAGTTS